MKKMYLRQDHVLVLKPKSLLLSRVRFLLLVFLPSLIELNNNNKKATKIMKTTSTAKKRKYLPGFSVLFPQCSGVQMWKA